MRKTILALALLAVLAPAVHAQQVFTFNAAPPRAWLGFSYDRTEVRRPGERTLTLTVTSVVKDSPAERAGLAGGDAILRINGLNATEQLISTLGTSMEPGDTVTFQVRRDGRERAVRIVAAEPPKNDPRLRRRILFDSAQSYLRVLIDSAAAGVDTVFLRHLPLMDSAFARGLPLVDSVFARGLPMMDTLFLRGLPHVDSLLRAYADDSSRVRIFTRGRVALDSLFAGSDSARFFPPFAFEFSSDELPGRDIIIRSVSAGHRAIAGAELQPLNPELARYFDVGSGVLVLNVPVNTPARRAGLQAGDVITAVAGNEVRSIGELRRAIERANGAEVRLDYVRQGRKHSLQLRK